jgi:hypothetical protein
MIFLLISFLERITNYGNYNSYFCIVLIMRIEFSHIGKQLSTRVAGAAVRKKIVQRIKMNECVVFDFTGVEIVSNSFADECFAKLMVEFDLPKVKEHTTFQNASPFIKAVIANSFKERLQAIHAH